MMAATLPPGAQDRLIKLAGLLGSSFDGERANAAAAATRLLQDNGLTWRDLLTPATPRPFAPVPTGWRAIAADCALMPERLTAWERDFLRGLPSFPRLSAKQQNTLDRIAARVLVDRA
jgi:hypothetical protein